jgi:hypothetical protein
MSCTAFSDLLVVLDDTKTLRYQIKRDGVVVDITGWTFEFGVKENPGDAAFVIGPVAGTIDDAANGKFSFEVLFDTLLELGVYEINYSSSSGIKETLTPGNGVEIRIVEKILV